MRKKTLFYLDRGLFEVAERWLLKMMPLIMALIGSLVIVMPVVSEEITTLEVWHTYTADTVEEELFTKVVKTFNERHKNITVKVVRIPYLQMMQQFTTSAQGGEAPDVLRVNSRDLGKLGAINVNGAPILEDLRPHITPAERRTIDGRAMHAMRYDSALYSIPVSQSSLSLIYNKAMFDAKGLAYPSDNWTTEDLLSTAKAFSQDGVIGLGIPLRVYFWWIPFQTGFGAWLFDEYGEPTLNAPGAADSLRWMLDLELKHKVTAPGTGFDIEAVKTQFLQGRAAMTIDGSWNWKAYEDVGLSIGQALLPTVAETGKRMSPLLTYIGWAISKQSKHKVASMQLIQWLASAEVQREFALETFSVPTDVSLLNDPLIKQNENLYGFMRQSREATPAPTTNAMSLAFEPLNVAIDMVYSGRMTAEEALEAANDELKSKAGK